jgi:hypothetical protein
MKVINFFGAPAAGKCLKKGTNVLLYDGRFVPIEQITINDVLMGPDSTPRHIKKLFYGIEQLYSIKLDNNTVIEATGNHILALKNTKKNLNKITFITIRDYVNKDKTFKDRNKLFFNGVEFAYKDVLIDPYYIGMWLGDGHSDAYNRITNADQEVVEYLKYFAENWGELSTLVKVGNSKFTYSIKRQINKGEPLLLKYFRIYNLLNNKHIPKNYLINDENTRLQILAGLIDSDGYFDKRKNIYEIITKFKKLSEDIKFICQSLGFKVTIINKFNKKYQKNYYRIFIMGKNLNKIPCKITRKKCTSDVRKTNTSLIKINSVTHNDNFDEYYGFELDGDNLFIIDNFIITHNSTTAAGLFNMMKMAGFNCELVTEYAKDLTWSDSQKALAYQPYVMANQQWRVERLNGLVDYVITDSPIILSSVYCEDTMPQCFHEYILWEHNRFPSINFYIERCKPYSSIGRNQTEKEANLIGEKIKEKIKKWNIEFHMILSGDGTAAITAFSYISSLHGPWSPA